VRVASGVCSDEAGWLIRPFAKWITRGVPFVTLKMGMTLDGRIADASGRSRWITSAVSRRVVRQLREEVDAILVGSSTAVRDDPSLLAGRASSPAWRVVVDAHGRLPPTAKLLNDGAVSRTIVATTRKCTPRRLAQWRARGATVWVLPEARGHVSLAGVLRRLGRMGLLHMLCEGGGEVAEALIRQRLVDEFVFFVAPRIMGGGGVPVVGGAGWSLAGAPRLKFVECRRVGPDLVIRAMPLRGGDGGQR
jgi:diaminohydroxyphosphoribosylaminopyrimidine deaminase/5-amino-6-(5-phosphoribosylamino)uracil reductase